MSWPRGNSRVWRLSTAATTAAYVKISPSIADYDREIAGYAYAARALAPHEAPRLLAADPGLQAIMSSPLPGQVVRGLPLAPVALEQHVHELAGRVLRRWHDHSGAASAHDLQAFRRSMTDQADEAAACLESTTGHLNAAQSDLVRAVARELPRLATQLPLVCQHGDYSTRNWLWDPDRTLGGHGHGLIDFAMTKYGPAVEEFVWLRGAVWAERPDLKATYLAGYGRPLTQTEERFLLLLTARLGVSYLSSGLTKERADLVERGKLILTRMTSHFP
ncbi:aminoglycoside phosphotransferase family protein [Streptomyces sp. NPDC059994]|uniref:aminoglycoside phosphotransferase family protein n=1 Tax=Streptomyces sp. NPDC059994 TaxID=3347029 RepID=UPI00369F585F